MSEDQNFNTFNSDTASSTNAAGRLLNTGAMPNKAMALHPIGTGKTSHNQPRKELNENIKHGTSVFPFAAYIWEPQSFSSRVTLHWHKEVELVRFSKGTFKISVDMHDLVVENDAFLLLPGNIMHTFDLPANCEESAIVFDPKMLVMTHYDEVQSELFDALLSSNIPIPPIITAEHPAFNRIDKLYRYCARHGATKNASHRLLIKAKLLEIIALYHEYGLLSRKDSRKNIIQSKQDKLKDLLNYIDSHFAGPMTIRDASLRLGVTDQYFCRYFKKVTGMSFTEYLNDLRLRRAAKDIELTTRPISDIAYENGFENAGYFFKSFKLKFGVTPLRYRKRFIEESTRKALDTSTDLIDRNPTLSPTDIDHTSTTNGSDLNVNKTSPSVRAKSNIHHEQGIISIRDNKEEQHSADTEEEFYSTAPSFDARNSANLSAVYTQDSEITDENSELNAKLRTTASLFDDEDEYDLNTHTKASENSTDSGLIDINSQHLKRKLSDHKGNEPIDTNLVVNHLKTNDEIRQALKEHTITHLDALENEDDLYDDDDNYVPEYAQHPRVEVLDAANEDMSLEEYRQNFYPNGLNSLLAAKQGKGKSPTSDELTSSKENSTAKCTVFALQERFNLGDFNSPDSESKHKKRSTKKNQSLHSPQEEFWLDDEGNLQSQVPKNKTTASNKSTAKSRKFIEVVPEKGKPKTPSEIRDKIAELERRKHDPFGL